MTAVARMRYALGACRTIAASPYDGLDRVLERTAAWRDERAGDPGYQPRADFEAALHEQLGADWPCPFVAEFESLWAEVVESLRAAGAEVGRASYAGWDDADPALARSAWCLCRHLRPAVVVETGVARGLSSRVILEALARDGGGRLWSIDLPPLLDRSLGDETGAAVPDRLRGRWTLLRASSRRALPGLVAGLSQLGTPPDLFLHDSIHTGRNLRFELDTVWPA
ncbi:MAG: class I SAM-dependent methyltransferase, partial [Thermoleophilaceae bacterium]